MNVCIVGPRNSKSSLHIKLLLEKRGHVCKTVKLSDIYFKIETGNFVAEHRKLNLKDFDIFIFRHIAQIYKNEAFIFAKYLYSINKLVIDEYLTKQPESSLHMLLMLTKRNIPVVNTVFTLGLKASRDILMELGHPIIVKPKNSKKERYTVSEDWTDSYDIVRTEKSRKFELQEFIDTKNIYRVYMVGQDVIGGIKKEVISFENKLHYSDKFKDEVFEVNNILINIAKQVSETLGFAFFHIDFVEANGRFHVLNVKRSTDFRNFSRLSGINYTEKIAEYIEKISQEFGQNR